MQRAPIVKRVFTVRYIGAGEVFVKQFAKPKIDDHSLSYGNAIACQALITGSEGSLKLEERQDPESSDLMTSKEFAKILGCNTCYIGSLVRRERAWDKPLVIHIPKPMDFKLGKSQVYIRKEVEVFAPHYEEYREQFRKYKGGSYVRKV